MKKLKKSTDPTTTIPVALAVTRVKRWLQIVGAMPGFETKHDSIPRAIFISFDDIKQLEADYPPDTLKGIRLYFGVAGEDQPTGPSVEDLRGMIVPVLKTDKPGQHKDLIESDEANPNNTSIYDFTTPCPKYCDVNSELYVPLS
jgi:hypothetical protein